MSGMDGRLEAVLDAAYACFVRHGLKRTTMDDIAHEVGLSRPTLYLSVRNKDEAFAMVARRLLDRAGAAAAEAAQSQGELAQRVAGVLETKLRLAITLNRDSPAHAQEFLSVGSRLLGMMVTDYEASLAELVTDLLADQVPRVDAAETAAILVALTFGLESDLTDPDIALDRLRRAVRLIIGGLMVSGR
ncbi:TetR/AcrR family transcriptional regulator [Rhodococcus tibetensis]|uniref:TetR/AcrR family transcriptional regulator n=1 Tax=Rhodococcus tibetensis TaxID=2965064 RepID=A0ABT1QNJ6_9NOCA|nr:TetR/AcrR family transcriptional regulator [Rhodococcus sp. FXJ9.536]MCQ4122710.1 TetR/AcrR family transcriptional regulator [Rhodococcus sp. FXJ9.536]